MHRAGVLRRGLHLPIHQAAQGAIFQKRDPLVLAPDRQRPRVRAQARHRPRRLQVRQPHAHRRRVGGQDHGLRAQPERLQRALHRDDRRGHDVRASGVRRRHYPRPEVGHVGLRLHRRRDGHVPVHPSVLPTHRGPPHALQTGRRGLRQRDPAGAAGPQRAAVAPGLAPAVAGPRLAAQRVRRPAARRDPGLRWRRGGREPEEEEQSQAAAGHLRRAACGDDWLRRGSDVGEASAERVGVPAV
mmetsp:Transcript_20507/g.34111  ORF Transcript_20507/g.34111 Transcript_20507/m.34111 type:complete len:243 (-) Transcript_20507:1327-2055(-)